MSLLFFTFSLTTDAKILRSPYAIDRYISEVKRLFSVLDKNLSTREYIAGPDYGIADIKTFPWVRGAPRVGIDLAEYPHIQKWIEKIEARPAVKEGLTIPKAPAA